MGTIQQIEDNMSEYIIHTIKKEFLCKGDKFNVIFTQKLHPEFNIGHYNLAVLNEHGDCVHTMSNTGAPQDKMTEEKLALKMGNIKSAVIAYHDSF